MTQHEGSPRGDLDAIIEDCDSMLYLVARIGEEDTVSLIPEDEARAIEEEITRQVHEEDSSSPIVSQKKLKSLSLVEATAVKGDTSLQVNIANMPPPPPRSPIENSSAQLTQGQSSLPWVRLDGASDHPLITKDDISLQYQKKMSKIRILDKILRRLKDFEGKEDLDVAVSDDKQNSVVKNELQPNSTIGNLPSKALLAEERESKEETVPVEAVVGPKEPKSEEVHVKQEKTPETPPKSAPLTVSFKSSRPAPQHPEANQSSNTPLITNKTVIPLSERRKGLANATSERPKITEVKERLSPRSEKLASTNISIVETGKADLNDLGHKRQRKPNGQYFNDSFDVKGKGTDLLSNRNGVVQEDQRKQEKRRPGRPKKERAPDGQPTTSGHQKTPQLTGAMEAAHTVLKPQTSNVEHSKEASARHNLTESRSGRQRKANSRYANEETITAITGLKSAKETRKPSESEQTPGGDSSPGGLKRGSGGVLQSDAKRLKPQMKKIKFLQAKRKGQPFWTREENLGLLEGIEAFGFKWTEIARNHFPDSLRTPVHLKDRWRNLVKSSQSRAMESEKEEISEDVHKRIKAILRSMNRVSKSKR